MAEDTPLVSIVVLAYNHLDYTRECVESIYRYTSNISFELITINNGSNDGTEEYFNSLPDTIKISFPENIGVCRAINHGFRIARGKYTMNVSNDIVVMPYWLDNLLICMESDPKIGMAVPVCDASCNYQQMVLPYRTMEELQEKAAVYNVSNPALWEERLKLSTYAGIYRTELQKTLGGFDEDFNPGCYDDDAICFSIRRMGYKVIFAKDCFVHHYGAHTFTAEYDKDKGLAMRNKLLFMRKFAAEPYVAGLIDYNIINLVRYSGGDNLNILGLGSSYGTTPLQLKNTCKSKGSKNIGLYYLTQDAHTMTDLKTICDYCAFAPLEKAPELFGSRAYDYIIVEADSRQLQNRAELFTALYAMLKASGQLVCTAANPQILYETMGMFYHLGGKLENQFNNCYYLCFSKPE